MSVMIEDAIVPILGIADDLDVAVVGLKRIVPNPLRKILRSDRTLQKRPWIRITMVIMAPKFQIPKVLTPKNEKVRAVDADAEIMIEGAVIGAVTVIQFKTQEQRITKTQQMTYKVAPIRAHRLFNLRVLT